MPALQHSFKTLRREWRSGEFRLIAAAPIVAVAAVTAVTLFTDRAASGASRPRRSNKRTRRAVLLAERCRFAKPHTFTWAPWALNGTAVGATRRSLDGCFK